jgi:pimeloyl-ACP methyl ester carboxylesterase/tellurite resistance protein
LREERIVTTRDRQIGATTAGDAARAGKAAARAGNGSTDQMPPKTSPDPADLWSPLIASFAGLAEAPLQWLSEAARIGTSLPSLSQAAAMIAPKAGAAPGPAEERARVGWMQEALDYWLDAAQRQILFWDVLRQRGNQTLEHYRAGKPPVLIFDHELIVDGRQLDRPVNYMLLRIKAERGVATDQAKRPFVIVDPRAGHGPGIGGMKESSQVGIALRNGHPVYFVAFHPEPEPGQTIADIAWAEAQFLLKVQELHPKAEGKPVVVGNCQAGWAIMMLAAAAPDLVGLVSIAGSPLSYWAGVEGKNPMRYSGGLLGGSWLAALAGDLGNGRFDGAHLVANFENLNPANTLWTKQYNLYSKIDTEEPRYLDFEKWWSGYFFMTKEEIRAIVDELFVGNKLTQGTIQTRDRRAIDLRNIKAPIVVIASWGDNITPPQQALFWIADLYDNVAQIVANEQTIIYTLDQRIGHLGIFVSAKVAEKQHAELVNTLDLIEVLPPGLYEMVIEDKAPGDVGAELLPGQFLVRFEGRTVEDILKLGDGREHEQAFETVARISEINEGLYETWLGPWVRMWSNEATAQALQMLHPLRLERLLLSDLNPAIWPLRVIAELVRKDRRPAATGNPFVTAEHAVSEQIEQALDRYREGRDRLYELAFKTIYTSPVVEALAGLAAPHADPRKPRARNEVLEKLFEAKIAAIRAREAQGGFAEAVVRIMLAGAKAHRMIDARGFRLAQQLAREHPRLQGLSDERLKAIVKEEAFMIRFDEEHALASLPELLRSETERREALAIVRQVGRARGEISAEGEALLARIERILGLEPKPASEPAPAKKPAPPAKKRPAPARTAH